MSRILFAPALLLLLALSCTQSPKNTAAQVTALDSVRYIPIAKGWINDYVNLFSPEEARSLDSIIAVYEKRSSVEIAVATVDSSMRGPIDFEPYSLLMMRTWGVGKKDKNNGVLIVIAPDLRRIRIQNGYGIVHFISDEETKEIIDYGFVPYFKRNEFYGGTRNGILAIIKKLDEEGYK